MMIEALNKKGYNAFAFSVPTLDEILTIVRLAAPVFVTMMSKVKFLLDSLLLCGQFFFLFLYLKLSMFRLSFTLSLYILLHLWVHIL